jgi:hypothetical protein
VLKIFIIIIFRCVDWDKLLEHYLNKVLKILLNYIFRFVDWDKLLEHYNKVLKIPLTRDQLEKMLERAGFKDRNRVTPEEFSHAVKAGFFDLV